MILMTETADGALTFIEPDDSSAQNGDQIS
jgi:hypothetical protein